LPGAVGIGLFAAVVPVVPAVVPVVVVVPVVPVSVVPALLPQPQPARTANAANAEKFRYGIRRIVFTRMHLLVSALRPLVKIRTEYTHTTRQDSTKIAGPGAGCTEDIYKTNVTFAVLES
jgi:hypothetical protein